jgi:hypothetical protein
MAKGKHDFPKGVNAKDKILVAASCLEGVLAVGSRLDRLSAKTHKDLKESADGIRRAEHAVCFGKFNRKEGTEVYQKPFTLFKAMCDLFEIRKMPKLNASSMNKELQKMTNPKDGGHKFCYHK